MKLENEDFLIIAPINRRKNPSVLDRQSGEMNEANRTWLDTLIKKHFVRPTKDQDMPNKIIYGPTKRFIDYIRA